MSEDFQRIRLGDVADVIDPQPDHRAPKFVEGGLSYIGIGDIDADGHIHHEQCRKVSEAAVAKQERAFSIEYEDIAFGRVGTVGKVVYLKEKGRYAVSATLVIIKPRAESIDRHFLFHLLQSRQASDTIEFIQIGSTRPALGIQQIRDLTFTIPDLCEQRRIAAVLDTLDTDIHATEKLIAKLRLARTALLQTLLTCGIDEYGCIRDPLRQPWAFKETELGLLPKEWEVMTLGNAILPHGGLIQTGPFGSQLHAREYVRDGIPVIMPQDIVAGHLDVSRIATISAKKAGQLSRHRVTVNDVVFARRGELDRCAVIGAAERGWLCGTGCLLVRPPRLLIDGRWLAAAYRHPFCQQQIQVRASGSTMANLNTTLLMNLLVAFPPYREQTMIAAYDTWFDARIRTEEARLAKLRLVRRGLMDDLLCGRVRVRV